VAEAYDIEVILGELGCGDLIFEVRDQLDRFPTGTRVCFVTRDPGARLDLPAFCRQTGHDLVGVEPPRFVIRRNDEP